MESGLICIFAFAPKVLEQPSKQNTISQFTKATVPELLVVNWFFNYMRIMNLTEKEQIIFDAIVAGRTVQDFLWGELSLSKENYLENREDWTRVFQKRVDKISHIDFTHPSAKVELRKRLLQQAALSIQAIEVLDKYIDFPKLK